MHARDPGDGQPMNITIPSSKELLESAHSRWSNRQKDNSHRHHPSPNSSLLLQSNKLIQNNDKSKPKSQLIIQSLSSQPPTELTSFLDTNFLDNSNKTQCSQVNQNPTSNTDKQSSSTQQPIKDNSTISSTTTATTTNSTVSESDFPVLNTGQHLPGIGMQTLTPPDNLEGACSP